MMPSRPARDAWIETSWTRTMTRSRTKSRPARDAWIETQHTATSLKPLSSRPARDAWIETSGQLLELQHNLVASRTGRVD